jgi:type III secretion protein Q
VKSSLLYLKNDLMQLISEHIESQLAGKLQTVEAPAVRWAAIFCDERFDSFLQILGTKINTEIASIASKKLINRLKIICDAGFIELTIETKNHPALELVYANDLGEHLRKLAAEALCSPIFQRLEVWGISNAYIDSIDVGPSAGVDVAALPWYIATTVSGQPLSFVISEISDGLYDFIRQKISLVEIKKNAYRALALNGRLALSIKTMRLAALRTLSVGDVVLTDMDADINEKIDTTIYWGMQDCRRLAASCQVMGNCLTLTGEPSMVSAIETDADEAVNLSSDKLSDFEISVRFEIESVAIPLSDLESIKPGYVIELTSPVDRAAIRLIAAGQIVGHAELVAVGNRLGARITRMVNSNESKSAS